MARKGKFHKWLEKEQLTLLEGWARSGLSNEQIAHNMGINNDTLYTWIKKFPDISDAIKKGKEVADFEIENAMFKAAQGYEYEEVKQYIKKTANGEERRIEKTMKHIPPNVTAQIFWLKNRKPDDWRDKREHEHSGEMTQNVNSMTNLSEEQLRKLAEMEGE